MRLWSSKGSLNRSETVPLASLNSSTEIQELGVHGAHRARLGGALAWATFGAFAVWFAANLIPKLALRLEFEDQLIVLRFARNMAEGNGLVYNAGERVMGFTTPLFTLLSALFAALGGEWAPAWQNVFGILCMLGTAALAARILIQVGAAPAAPLAVALLTFEPAAADSYVYVGMEVHLFSLLFLLALDLHLNRRTTAASVASGFLFLTRPEGALLAAMLLADVWYRRRKVPIVEASAALATVFPWLLFATLYYGSPVPATLPAKRGALLVHAQQYLERVAEIYADAAISVAATVSPSLAGNHLAWLPLAVVAVVGCIVLVRRQSVLWPLVGFPVLSTLCYAALGAWPEFTWHYYPLNVLSAFSLALGVHAATSEALRRAPNPRRHRTRPSVWNKADAIVRKTATVAVLLALTLAVLASTYRLVAHNRYEPDARSQGLASMGRSLGDEFEDGTSVLLDEIGHIGWESRLKIVDQAGLVTPGLRYDVPRHLAVQRHRPDLLLLHDEAPLRHGVKQTEAFPLDLGYELVPDFPTAPEYRLYELGRGSDVPRNPGPSAGSYLVQRNEAGHVEALLLDPGPSSAIPPRRFAVAGSDKGALGFIDHVSVEPTLFTRSRSNLFTVGGWAVDPTSPASFLEAVIVGGDEVVGSTNTGLPRGDVAAEHGSPFKFAGFSLRVATDPDRVADEGLEVYSVSDRGFATRLQFLYQPLKKGWLGRQTLPVTDGRRLTVQAPGDALGGSLDVVTTRGDATIIEGWAADLERRERPRQIVVYRDGQFLTSLGVNRKRSDVARHYGDDRLLRTGFRGAVSGAPNPDTFGDRHRVFAIMLRGVALELSSFSASTRSP